MNKGKKRNETSKKYNNFVVYFRGKAIYIYFHWCRTKEIVGNFVIAVSLSQSQSQPQLTTINKSLFWELKYMCFRYYTSNRSILISNRDWKEVIIKSIRIEDVYLRLSNQDNIYMYNLQDQYNENYGSDPKKMTSSFFSSLFLLLLLTNKNQSSLSIANQNRICFGINCCRFRFVFSFRCWGFLIY